MNKDITMDNVEYKDFKIGDLFDCLKTLKPGYKLDTQKFRNNEYNVPATSSTETNNSIGFYVKDTDHDIVSNVLSVTSNGAAGFIAYHPERIAVAQDSYLIKSKVELGDTRSFYLYVSSVLSKQTTAVFSYTNKCTWARLKELSVSLPVTTDGTPDYAHMERYIGAIEKLHVQAIEKLLNELGYSILDDVTLTDEDKSVLTNLRGGG